MITVEIEITATDASIVLPKYSSFKFISFIHSEVSVEDVRQAIQSVDPEAPAEIVDKYLGRAFNTAADQLETGTKIEATLLLKRLQNGSVRRLGPRPK